MKLNYFVKRCLAIVMILGITASQAWSMNLKSSGHTKLHEAAENEDIFSLSSLL